MSVIETLTLWDTAVRAAEAGDYRIAIENLEAIKDPTSLIYFNMGVTHLAMGDLDNARQSLFDTTKKDAHLAIAYFVRGVVQFKLKNYADACNDFDMCHKRIRAGTSMIDYNQMGMRHKLFAYQALYNGAVSNFHLGKEGRARELLLEAQSHKGDNKSVSLLEEALRAVQLGVPLEIIDLPKSVFFGPPRKKVSNIPKKDYLGKAKVVSSDDPQDSFAGFEGPRRREAGFLVPPEVQKSHSAPTSPKTQRSHSDFGLPPNKPLPPRPKQGSAEQINTPQLLDRVALLAKGAGPRRQTSPSIFVTNYGVNGQVRRAEDANGQKSSNISRTPPPSRPPPKLRRDDSDIPPKFENLNKPLPKLPKRPLPQVATIDVHTRAPLKSVVEVTFHCNTDKVIRVRSGLSLSEMIQKACECFNYTEDAISLWYSNDDEKVCILNNEVMKDVWFSISQTKSLDLWIYGKFKE